MISQILERVLLCSLVKVRPNLNLCEYNTVIDHYLIMLI